MKAQAIPIDFTSYTPKIRDGETYREIFDPLRKKFLKLTPEEWVRQLFICHLIESLDYPKGRIGSEVGLKLHGLSKRCDLVVYDENASPKLIVECKAPDVKITQAVLDQIGRYNLKMQVPFLVVTNLRITLAFQISQSRDSWVSLGDIPVYITLNDSSESHLKA